MVMLNSLGSRPERQWRVECHVRGFYMGSSTKNRKVWVTWFLVQLACPCSQQFATGAGGGAGGLGGAGWGWSLFLQTNMSTNIPALVYDRVIEC